MQPWAVAIALSLGLIAPQPTAAETAFTAAVVLEKMDAVEQYTFVSGIVEGIAAARFAAERPTTDGRACIYGWFYGEDEAIGQITAAFAQLGDYLPGEIVLAMIERRCP